MIFELLFRYLSHIENMGNHFIMLIRSIFDIKNNIIISPSVITDEVTQKCGRKNHSKQYGWNLKPSIRNMLGSG